MTIGGWENPGKASSSSWEQQININLGWKVPRLGGFRASGVPITSHKPSPGSAVEAQVPNLDQTHTFHRRHIPHQKVFQARGVTVTTWPRKCSRLFCLPEELQLWVFSSKPHTREPGCSVWLGAREEDRRAPCPTPFPKLTPGPRWAGPRWAGPGASPSEGPSLTSRTPVLSRSQRESLCFCQSLPCLQVGVSSTTSSRYGRDIRHSWCQPYPCQYLFPLKTSTCTSWEEG